MKIDGECLIELIGSCRNKVQVYRSVRMPQLHTSLHFHLTPIGQRTHRCLGCATGGSGEVGLNLSGGGYLDAFSSYPLRWLPRFVGTEWSRVVPRSPQLGTYYSPRWRRADIEVPNLPVDVSSWEDQPVIPRGSGILSRLGLRGGLNRRPCAENPKPRGFMNRQLLLSLDLAHWGHPRSQRGPLVSNQNTQQALALPEKEVIQPHLPVRLPCYDFTPVTSPAFGIPLLVVKVTTSGMASSHSVTGGLRSLRDLTQHLTARADDSHAPPVSAFPKAPLSFKRIRGMSSPGGILNALATALHGSIRTAPSIHRLRLGLLGYLIPFAPLAFVSQCQCRPSRVLSPLVFFPISTHFTAPPEIPSAPTVLQLDALRPIIPDNACILCITAAAGTELADAYSPDTVIASSPGKEVHDPSLGRVSVPVWLIILSDQLLIIALPFPAVVPLPRAGSYALLTRPPLETPLPVRLACVKHAASVHPEPGSNSP
uniref:Uncharacterized protein n=1 Tax=Fagus sylvatica TaxID=28930 RepID=A0A2N9HN32_FAGSY